jgi:hypothetical protein
MDRAMFHVDNVYKIPAVRVVGHTCKTNLASNTAFRGFGGPQVAFSLARCTHTHCDLNARMDTLLTLRCTHTHCDLNARTGTLLTLTTHVSPS